MQNNLSRRNFLKTGGAMAGIGLFGLSAARMMVPFETPYFNTIGLQLYTVRDQIAADPEGTLKAIKDYGYYQVEVNDAQIEKLMPITKDLGLQVKSSFINWSTITQRWDLREKEIERVSFESILELAHKNEITHLVFGYMLPGERSSLDDYRKICDELNKAGELCKQAGIQLCYHNHNFEFLPMGDKTGYDILMERLDEQLVQFELDVFWSSLAGVDPIPLMKKLKKRVRLLHLKDKLANTPIIYKTGDTPRESFKALGEGIVDIEGVIKLGEKYGVDYCMVEQDHSPNPIKSIGTSIQYLRKL